MVQDIDISAGGLDDPQLSPELLARIPAGRFGRDTDIAATVEFMLSNQAPFLSGASISVSGANHI